MTTQQPTLPWEPYDLATELTRAVIASQMLLAGTQLVALEAAHSACVPTGRPEEFLEQLVRGNRRIFLALLATGAVLLLGMAGLSLQLGKIPWGAPNRLVLLFVALGMLVAALACFVMAAMSSGWWYHREVKNRLDAYRGTSVQLRRRFVNIEYPAAISQTSRPVTSDVGYVVFDPAHRRIIVEGILLRHVIRAEDVLEMKEVESADIAGIDNTQAHVFRIHYRIHGDVGLVISLEDDALAAEYLREWLGRKPLVTSIRAALAGK